MVKKMQTFARPQWLKKRVPLNPDVDITRSILRKFNINTVCEAARCPNTFDCFSKKRATFLMLGSVCSRKCGFCALMNGTPEAVDESEAARITEAARLLGLRHVIITSVTRDDLDDGGAGQFVRAIKALRGRFKKGVKVEVLVPDFKANAGDIKAVVDAGPDVFGHNIETVPRLYKIVRPKADYRRSLDVLRIAKGINPNLTTKSGFMLGLGEIRDEIIEVMEDLRNAGCDILTIGQYLRPGPGQVKVVEFIHPDKFKRFEKIGYSLGFRKVTSEPFARSSYEGGI